MYEFIRGRLAKATPSMAVLDVGGIGYRIYIPTNLYAKLPPSTEECLLYISAVMRESEQTLYGFITAQQRDTFEVLIAVSGVGPKTALALLSTLTPDELQDAIYSNAVQEICRVPGIGKKTAERLIIDVRDKLPSLFNRPIQGVDIESSSSSQLLQDAMSALVNLGYTQVVAHKAIKKVLAESEVKPDLAVLITKALQLV